MNLISHDAFPPEMTCGYVLAEIAMFFYCIYSGGITLMKNNKNRFALNRGWVNTWGINFGNKDYITKVFIKIYASIYT